MSGNNFKERRRNLPGSQRQPHSPHCIPRPFVHSQPCCAPREACVCVCACVVWAATGSFLCVDICLPCGLMFFFSDCFVCVCVFQDKKWNKLDSNLFLTHARRDLSSSGQVACSVCRRPANPSNAAAAAARRRTQEETDETPLSQCEKRRANICARATGHMRASLLATSCWSKRCSLSAMAPHNRSAPTQWASIF